MSVPQKPSAGRRLATLAAAFLYGACAMNAAVADDAEIFFPEEDDFELEGELRPNILFMIDTSGSMGNSDSGQTGTRMVRLRTAFKQLMDEMKGETNIGLGRYSYFEGGAILVPVSPIDSKIKEVLTEELTLSRTVTQGNEAIQNQTGGAVTLISSNPLKLGSDSDASGAAKHRNALRFENIAIPRGVTINSAAIEFKAQAATSREITLSIQVEQSGDAAPLVDTTNNLSSRTYGSTVSWTSPASWTTYNADTNPVVYTTDDFASLVDTVVKRNDWCGGNALVVSINMTSTRGFRPAHSASANDPDLAPTLKLSFNANDPNLATGCTTQQRTVASQPSARSDDAQELPQDVRQQVTLGNWSGWSNWTGWTNYSGPYNSSTNCNNAPRPNTGITDTAFDAHGNATTQTERGYQCSGSGSSRYVQTRTRTRTRNSTTTNVNSRSVITGQGTLELGTTSVGAQIVGLRFPRLAVPRNAEIVSAYIDFTPAAVDSAGANFTISAENSANAAAFPSSDQDCQVTTGNPSCAYLLSVRKQNTIGSAINWSGADMQSWNTDCTGGCIRSSPNVGSLVQAIVNQGTWNPGNAAVMFIEGTGLRRARAYDGSASAAPKLRVTYTLPPSEFEAGFGDMTVREYLKQTIDQLPASGSTPTVGALYEATRYMRGESAYFGRTRGMGESYDSNDDASYNHSFDGTQSGTNRSGAATSRLSDISTFTTASAATANRVTPVGCTKGNYNTSTCDLERYTGTPVYQTPIEFGCQPNSIVLLSDGEPTSNKQRPVEELLINKIKTEYNYGNACKLNGAGKKDGACGPELAAYMFKNDNNDTLLGNQFIKTYAIAFGDPNSKPYLDEIAKAGGTTSAYLASSVTDLVGVFRAITAAILDINTTFVSPAVTVNTFNRLTHRNELYFAVFQPDNRVKWQGNLKRYVLDPDTTTIRDADGNEAVDAETGFFKSTARSWWSTTADGANVAKGGAAGKLNTSRKIYTYVGSAAPDNVDLTQSAQAFNTTNVTAEMLGISAKVALDPGYHSKLVDWTRGIDVLGEHDPAGVTDARTSYGDPLHSEPVLITYGGTEDAPDMALFFGTNEGGLHAIDASANGGTEHWSFLPRELLPNLDRFYANSTSYKLRPHGLDGPITNWVRDANQDGKLLAADNDHAYLYVGMRRGGRNYYALDVTDRTTPKLKFTIRGGSGNYTELGETWSRALPARIRFNGQIKDVLIFSGGYDEANDDEATATPATHGRALYIADASTGARLWWAGPADESGATAADVGLPDLIYSTPGTPKAIDLDGDGLVDRIYMADVGGQIFRFILNPANTGAGNLVPALNQTVSPGVTATRNWYQRIAKLSGNTAADARRFYVSPDIASIRKGVTTPFLSISIGSGNRNHPLNKQTNDRFYILRDPDVAVGQNSALFIQDADLYDATTNAAGSTDAATATQARTAINNAKGFFISMGKTDSTRSGEKVMTEAQTFDNQILFASYQPEGRAAFKPCAASEGLSRFYIFSVIDGQPTQNFADPDSEDKPRDPDERFKELGQGGLPPDPAILFPNRGNMLPDEAVVCIGPECFNPGLTITIEKTYWLKRR